MPDSQLPNYCSREEKNAFKWQQNTKEKQIFLLWNLKQKKPHTPDVIAQHAFVA